MVLKVTFSDSILAATEASGIIDMGYAVPSLLILEAAPVGTSLSFNVGATASSLLSLNDANGDPLTVDLSTAKTGAYILNPMDFQGVKFLQVVSNGAETVDIAIKIVGVE